MVASLFHAEECVLRQQAQRGQVVRQEGFHHTRRVKPGAQAARQQTSKNVF
jgi:hypothetical protein